jgi:hypothetical protein
VVIISNFSDQDYEHEQRSDKDKVRKSYSADENEIRYVPDNYSRMPESIIFYCRLMACLVMLISFLLMFDDFSNFKHFVRWLLIWLGTELVGFAFGFHWLRRRVGRK